MRAARTPRLSHAARRRLVALTVAGVGLAWLGVAAWFNPDPTGHGTHQQLGLHACGLLTTTGFPCTTCGMTTAFAYAADGRFVAAFITQPAGALLALTVAAVTMTALWAAWSGMSLLPLGRALAHRWVLWPAGAIALAAWAYKAVMVKLGA